MNTENKMYLTAEDVSKMLGVSIGHSYKLIREMNFYLKKEGYLVIAGKVPTGYFKKKWYGMEFEKEQNIESTKR